MAETCKKLSGAKLEKTKVPSPSPEEWSESRGRKEDQTKTQIKNAPTPEKRQHFIQEFRVIFTFITPEGYCSVFSQSSRWKIEHCSSELLYKREIKFSIELALSPSLSPSLTKFWAWGYSFGCISLALASGTSTRHHVWGLLISAVLHPSADGIPDQTWLPLGLSILENKVSLFLWKIKI